VRALNITTLRSNMSDRQRPRFSVSEWLGVLWCRLMHPSPMWPIRGHYRCRACGRSYLIAWDAGDAERRG
jgi:hypothetical protein